MSIEAMKQAREVIELGDDASLAQRYAVLTNIDQAIAEAEKQEPVAYLYHDARTPMDAHPWLHSTMLVLAADRRQGLQGETPLYTHPPKREPLTNEQIREIVKHREGYWCADLTCSKCYSANFRFKHTTPPKREWVGLTPADFDKLEQLFGNKVSNDFVFADIVCAIEAKLKDKNA